jgi:hypothetical protein
MIALQRGKALGVIRGGELDRRLHLGAEMLIDRACPEGGWNAGNAVVYGVALRPHIEPTALALCALRSQPSFPIVRSSMSWLLSRIGCPSAYSLAWLILAASAYAEVMPEVLPAVAFARARLVSMVEEPERIDDTATIALAALALDARPNANPFVVMP